MRLLTAEMTRIRLGCDVLIGGSSAVRYAGWTTQQQMLPEVLTRGTPAVALSGMRIRPRSPEIFDLLLGYAEASRMQGVVPMGDVGPLGEDWLILPPEVAIADALLDRRSGRATHIFDADDLDPDEIDPLALSRLPDVMRILGAGQGAAELAMGYLEIVNRMAPIAQL